MGVLLGEGIFPYGDGIVPSYEDIVKQHRETWAVIRIRLAGTKLEDIPQTADLEGMR